MDIGIKKLLLVEDNPGDVRLLVELLHENKNCEFSLAHVDRIKCALEHLENHDCDLLLLDLALPDGSGLDAVRLLCGAAPQLPIIVLTGLADDGLAIEAV